MHHLSSGMEMAPMTSFAYDGSSSLDEQQKKSETQVNPSLCQQKLYVSLILSCYVSVLKLWRTCYFVE